MEQPISVLGIVASPQRGGSTAAAVQTFLKGAANTGADINLIDVALADTASTIEAINGADAVVFGSPTYRASHTALLSGLLERIERGMKRESTAPLRGKATAVVMTGAASEHFLATEGLRTKLSAFFAAQVLSPSLYLQQDAFEKNHQLVAQARELVLLHGAALVELASATKHGTALPHLKPLI